MRANVKFGNCTALLSATLRTYQKAACDTDQVVIACPRGTSISIEFAQYNKFIAKDGISIDELCPTNGDSNQDRAKTKHLLRGSTFGSHTQKVPPNRYANSGHLSEASSSLSPTPNASDLSTISSSDSEDNSQENCMWPNALQYSLLQTVVEACQKKKHCKFEGRPQFYGLGTSGVGDTSGTSSYHSSTISTNNINVDPCPKKRKIVEIAYKCRPYEFRSKVACHNDVAQLECNPYSRIAVYSASFGRTEYESIQCPQPQGVREETCLASYATETVMQICHGRRRCNLAADANTFGSPCHPNSRMYLKVVYTCVPKQVLMDRYESGIEADELEDFEGDINELYDDEYYKESEPIPKLYSNATAAATRNSTIGNITISNNRISLNGSFAQFESETGSVNPVMTHSADLNLEGDQERLFFYLLSAGSIGVILCIVAIIARIVVQRHEGFSTDTHSTSSIKGCGVTGVGSDSNHVGEGVGETTLPKSFNDTISEIDADINLQTTPISVPSVSKNGNYITYAPASNLYVPPNDMISHSVTLDPLPPNLIGNTSLLCGSRQSPDVLGISAQKYASVNNSTTGSPVMGGVLAQTIVIGAANNPVDSSSTNVISAVVPITSLAQYTTAPTFRSGYLINTENILQRQLSTTTRPISTSNGETYRSQQYQKQQQPQSIQTPGSSVVITATSTLRRIKAAAHHQQQTQILAEQPTTLSYDGIAPRTLSTGVPVNSQFYYE
uniref:SUEL-type lectin domain-containing protein n=1 Tax=Glossina brevipalpis TaxID=37001 RepID=A0A1A9W723_9MUSC